MVSREPFTVHIASFEENLSDIKGLAKDKNSFVAKFTPSKSNPKKGSIVYNDKTVEVGLRPKSQIITYQAENPNSLDKGLWEVKLIDIMKANKSLYTIKAFLYNLSCLFIS